VEASLLGEPVAEESEGPAPANAGDLPAEGIPAEEVQPAAAMTRGERLYGAHCAACHGEAGDGDGPAAAMLYPRPRDFREGNFRLVTTTNRVPSDSDLRRVLELGMPGSSMFPFDHLSEADLKALVVQVRSFLQQGVEDRLRGEAAEFGEELHPKDLEDALAALAEPGSPLEIPAGSQEAGGESVGRGRVLYAQNCAACHGETGKGDGAQEQKDESGMLIRPRDFTRGIFKGGREREQLFARIVLGAPGTPMPGSPALRPDEVDDLINFVLSLSDASVPSEAEHRRTRMIARRVPGLLPEAIPDPAWDVAEPTPIVVSPLWWREYDAPDLRVQAIHDGRSLAIRLSWRDETRDHSAIRPQDFPDKAAVQFFRGEHEPFLGMGAMGGEVDIWLWDASAQADLGGFADVESVYPDMAVDHYPFEEPSGGDGHPTARQSREFLSAWAAGNPRSDPTRPMPGSGHRASGFGTLTTHPIASQAVDGRGAWDEGRWGVVLRRPLRVDPDGGMVLAPGDRISIAFALWDGAARDRDGQKLVSIWHDLELEGDDAARSAPANGARR
jgi:mono/diheme cytochrome c family protein